MTDDTEEFTYTHEYVLSWFEWCAVCSEPAKSPVHWTAREANGSLPSRLVMDKIRKDMTDE